MPRGVVADGADVAGVVRIADVADEIGDAITDDSAEQRAQACRRRGGLADAASVLQAPS